MSGQNQSMYGGVFVMMLSISVSRIYDIGLTDLCSSERVRISRRRSEALSATLVPTRDVLSVSGRHFSVFLVLVTFVRK